MADQQHYGKGCFYWCKCFNSLAFCEWKCIFSDNVTQSWEVLWCAAWLYTYTYSYWCKCFNSLAFCEGKCIFSDNVTRSWEVLWCAAWLYPYTYSYSNEIQQFTLAWQNVSCACIYQWHVKLLYRLYARKPIYLTMTYMFNWWVKTRSVQTALSHNWLVMATDLHTISLIALITLG